MSDKKISYLSRSFDDYKNSLLEYTQEYYPEIAKDLDDASVGTWLIELMAAVGDNLSYYIDKTYNETNIDSAQSKGSILSIARTNGFRVPGPKGSIVELEFTCTLPPSTNGNSNSPSTLGMPDWTYAPIIKRGTRVAAKNGQFFETNEDLDFGEQFNSAGESNRRITPLLDSNNNVVSYRVSKTCTATSGVSKIFKMVIQPEQVKPFMEVIIPDKNLMGVESIILKDGTNYQTDPTSAEFSMQAEFLKAKASCDSGAEVDVDTYRFFEVGSLLDKYTWSDKVDYYRNGDYVESVPEAYDYGYYNADNVFIPVTRIVKGKWTSITQKFITEYTDNGYLKVIFGGGREAGTDIDVDSNLFSTQNQISRIIYNNSLGKLPKAGTTMFILYRVGGGASPNVPAGSISTISYLDAENREYPTPQNERVASNIISSITVTNTTPSLSGKNAPNVDEVRSMVKYHNAAQERCITVKDYQDRINKMPSRYGTPFRTGTIEENNKIMIYLLMVDYQGHLSDTVPSVMIENMVNYLSMYRSLNDYVEIKPGRIVNISVEADIYVDKTYDTGDVVKSVLNKIRDYMDVSQHFLGEDIYVSDLETQIGRLDGVLNLIDLRIYNEFGTNYSQTRTSQQTVNVSDTDGGYPTNEFADSAEIDLEASDYILNSEADEMFEIKYPEKDIRIRVKVR